MSDPDLTLEEITRFGIRPSDEGTQPWSTDYPMWNESYFFDWTDVDGAQAGHCRIGWEPNRDRLWFWLFLRRDGGWLAIEDPRLPLARLDLGAFHYEDRGLRFSYTTAEPLLRGRLQVEGFARALDGPRRGRVLPVAVDLDLRAVGAAHSRGGSRIENQRPVEGHSAEGYDTNRYEQPIVLDGTLTVDGDARSFAGRGERDHSWGPRVWDMRWRFLALNGEALRLQCAQVKIPNVPSIEVGYVHRQGTVDIEGATIEVDDLDDDPGRGVSGRLETRLADGAELKGRFEAIAGHEIDLSHSLEPPRGTLYRRSLVRFHPEGGEAPIVGWFEIHELPEAHDPEADSP